MEKVREGGLFCIFQERGLKFLTSTYNKKNGKMIRASRWVMSFLFWLEEKQQKVVCLCFFCIV